MKNRVASLLLMGLMIMGSVSAWACAADAQLARPHCRTEQLAYGICVTTDMDKAAQITEGPIFRAQFNGVVNAAKAYLDTLTPDAKKVAIFDLDETLVNNLAFYRQYKTFDPTHWNEWVNENKDGPYNQPVLDLVNYAKAKGFAVMFLTGRTADIAHDTLEQVHAIAWDGVFFRPGGTQPSSSRVFKAQVRKMLTAMGYQVVLNIGDQASDLDGPVDLSHPGQQSPGQFLLPNVMYSIP